jgi:hypothetical protein
MRERLNENPAVQAVLIGILAVGVIFLLFTRVMNRNSAAEDTTPATTPVEATAPAAAGTVDPATGATAAPPATPPVEAAPGKFAAGPGLPKGVVDAYDDGKVVTLLVVRERGIDDDKIRGMVEALRARGDTEVFVTVAAGIAKYSRITQGVDVDRVPALVVLRPKRLTDGPSPTASVSYGYRGPESVDQTVRDALYKGRDDIPFYPE